MPVDPKNIKKPPGLSQAAESTARFRTYDISSGGWEKKEAPRRDFENDTGAPDFDVDFDFDREYKDVPENKPLRFRRERRTGCVGGILYAVFVVCVSLLLASLLWMAAADVLGFGDDDEQVGVRVPSDFTIDDVADLLYDAGLIRYKSIFKLYAGYSNAEEKISSGSFILNKNYDYRALVYGMTARGGSRVETTVPFPEGFTLAEIFTRLDDFGVTPENELWEAAANHEFNHDFLDSSTLGDRLRLEGFLFPDTYNFFIDSTPVQAITRMLNQFGRVFTEEYVQRAEEMGYTVRDIIIIASMIEREAGSDEERPRIAAVIYNRLNNWDNPILQIDATISYILDGRPFSTTIDNPFNTYMYPGLPPGPISNPGLESIRAALYPESTNEYYYALNMEGTHNFFRTYEEQRAFVQSDDYGG